MSLSYTERMHRTTFRLDDEILAEAKALAARQHRSLNSVMEEALRRMLAAYEELADRPPVAVITSDGGGIVPGVDLSAAGIKKILDDEDVEHFLEVMADDARRHQRSRACAQP
jgi:enoyl-CoA hydratase/carnithine racemase